MYKNKLIFIGPLQFGEIPSAGDTTKNRLFYNRFVEVYDKVYSFDTYKWKKRPRSLIRLLSLLFFVRNAKVIISCERSASLIIDFLFYFRVQKQVFYWVIGCGFVERIKNKQILPNHYFFLKRIIVQSPRMVDTLQKAGLNNAIFIPNSKPVYRIDLKEHNKERTRFIFISRILPEKGADLILNSLARLNAIGYKERVSVDYYGVIDKNYTSFINRVKTIPNAYYRGILDLTSIDGYQVLSSYDLMLFPTYYKGEGFPGVLIDAFISGLPVIASDWHFNSEIIKDRRTGYVIPAKDEMALFRAMKMVVDNRDLIEAMRINCQEESLRYDNNLILSIDNLKTIGLI